jgi:dTDP-glucose pyrophosphorylase
MRGELQLTDAIQKLIDWDLSVYALKLDENYVRLDIGNPQAHWEALQLSYNRSISKQTRFLQKGCSLRLVG